MKFKNNVNLNIHSLLSVVKKIIFFIPLRELEPMKNKKNRKKLNLKNLVSFGFRF